MLTLRFSRQPVVLVAILLLASLMASACQADRPQATATSAALAATPVATAVAEATPPPATATPVPAPTTEPTTVIDVDALVGDLRLPAGVSPFTGLLVDDPALLERMPAAVKISNSPIARPQSGLSQADVVIEHLAEGDITRFTAIYHSQDAERIGSVRSARLIDLEIPVLFDAFLVYSGASGEVNRMIEASDFADRTLSDERKDPGFYRLDVPGHTYEHTLFTDSELLQEYAADQGWTTPPRYRGWQWSERPPRLAPRARSLTIPYSAEYSDVTYQYDPTLGAYRRSMLGEPHVDDLTGEQLTADNVVVLYANHVPTLIVEDALGSKSVEIQLWEQGRMQLFRDGTVQEGLWLRPQREDPLLFVDEAMQPLALKPGNVWIQIVPLGMDVTHAP
ncbi:MAG TPA: DUF3048 domain-containing protein [Anaerolineae bacterium]|nr:DUF3048 domain-containing protein [Anaerolineae bacterium]